jgi:hypothetical protein
VLSKLAEVKLRTQLALTLIQQAAREIDRLAATLSAQSIDKALPCSPLGGLAPFIEPWLEESLRRRLLSCKLDAVHGAVLINDPQSCPGSALDENRSKIKETHGDEQSLPNFGGRLCPPAR